MLVSLLRSTPVDFSAESLPDSWKDRGKNPGKFILRAGNSTHCLQMPQDAYGATAAGVCFPICTIGHKGSNLSTCHTTIWPARTSQREGGQPSQDGVLAPKPNQYAQLQATFSWRYCSGQ